MNLHDAHSALGLKHSGDTLISVNVCSHCQQCLTEYRFTANDGFSIATYHCREHGDVVPMRGAGAHDNPLPRYS